jgi:hypothetical protein
MTQQEAVDRIERHNEHHDECNTCNGRELCDIGESLFQGARQAHRYDKRPRCADCGELGERKGHMGCQYPQ